MRISSSQRDERLMAKGCGGAYHAYQTISERYQTYITLYRGTLVGSVRGGEWMLLSGVPWGGSVEGTLVVRGIMPYIKCIPRNIVLKYQTMYHVSIKKFQG